MREPQLHRRLRHPGNSEQWDAWGHFSASPLLLGLLFRGDQHQSPPLPSPSNLPPFFSPISLVGEWGRKRYRPSQYLFPPQVLTLQPTECQGLGKREKGGNQLHQHYQPSKGLLTSVSSLETFISHSYSTCIQRPKSRPDTLPPLERRQGLSLQIFASKMRKEPWGSQISCAGHTGSCRVFRPRNTPDSGHRALTDGRGLLNYNVVIIRQNLKNNQGSPNWLLPFFWFLYPVARREERLKNTTIFHLLHSTYFHDVTERLH